MIPHDSCIAPLRCPGDYVLSQFWQGAPYHPPYELAIGAVDTADGGSVRLDFRARSDDSQLNATAPLLASQWMACGAWSQLIMQVSGSDWNTSQQPSA